jgi:cardiolipin synthase
MIMASGFGSFIALAAYLWYNGETKEDVESAIEKK